MKNPLISFVIVDIQDHYLAPLTIESILKQDEKDCEIIVITKNIMPQDSENLREFSDFIKVKATKKKSVGRIMNEAAKLSRGKYLSFLFPGERCLSKYSIKYAKEKIEKNDFPDLVCFSFIERDIGSSPEVRNVSFSVNLVGGERYPLYAKDCIFLKHKFEKFKGFNSKYKYLASFDLSSRIFLKKGKVIYLKRIFTDYELQKKSPGEMIGHLSELITIIYKNFGFLNFAHFYVIREILYVFKWAMRGVSRHFIQKD